MGTLESVEQVQGWISNEINRLKKAKEKLCATPMNLTAGYVYHNIQGRIDAFEKLKWKLKVKA